MAQALPVRKVRSELGANPRWHISLSIEDQLLLICARQELSATDSEDLGSLLRESVNWDLVVDSGRWHKLTGLLSYHFRTPLLASMVPPEVSQELQQDYLQNTAKYLYRRTELLGLLNALSAEGIPVVVLKGAALVGTIYQEPGMRPMGDMDLLVPEDQVFTAQSIIQSLGYQAVGTSEQQLNTEKHHRHLPGLIIRGAPVMFEVHRHIVRRDCGFYFDIEEYWGRAQQVSIADTPAFALSQEDQLTHLCLNFFLDRQLHTRKSLGQLCDIAEVTRYCPIDWDALVRRGIENDMGGPLACSLGLARHLLDAPVPDNVVRSLGPTITDHELASFAKQRVLPIRKWVISRFGETEENQGSIGLLRALIRRLVPSREYMRLHYGGAGFCSYCRRIGRSIGLSVRFARYPSELREDLNVDRWMRSLCGEQTSHTERS